MTGTRDYSFGLPVSTVGLGDRPQRVPDPAAQGMTAKPLTDFEFHDVKNN